MLANRRAQDRHRFGLLCFSILLGMAVSSSTQAALLLGRDEILAKFPVGTNRQFSLSPDKVRFYSDGDLSQQKYPPNECFASIQRGADQLTFWVYGSQKIPKGIKVPLAGLTIGTSISDKQLPFANDSEVQSLFRTAEYKDGILRIQSTSGSKGSHTVSEVEFEVAPDLVSIGSVVYREWVSLSHLEDRLNLEPKTLVQCSSVLN